MSDKEESDSESELLSDTDSDSTSSNKSFTDGIGDPVRLARAGGPSMLQLSTRATDLRIQPKQKQGVQYSSFDLSGEYDTNLPFTGTSFDMETGNQTSVLIINSRNRDRRIYTQPTQFTLHVPRTYKNITSFQIVQLKLLSSFFYFRPDKENTKLQILENGRVILNTSNNLVPNSIITTIRTGTYDISTLLSEIQTQLNKTPLFFYYPNGISDFISVFTSSGDLSLGFNQPGDTYYDTLRSKFITNPTIAIIVSYYFNSQYAGLSSYTIQQIKYAYYYPVLYECYLDSEYGPSLLNLTLSSSSLQAGETIDQRILYTKQGLNDSVIAELITNNLSNMYKSSGINILDYYRTRHTFFYSLVNQYNCTYESFNNRINISSSNLNTSLVNLINFQTTKELSSELNARGMTSADYSSLATSVSLNTAVFTNMYNLLQSNIANFFGINFNTYAPEFFADLNNSLFVQNGIGATGIDTGYSLDVLQKGNTPITSSTSNLRDTQVYWPKLKNLANGSIHYPINLVDNSNVPYDVASKTFINKKFVDNSGFVYTDIVHKSGDIVIPIESSKYTVFRFHSPVRQNLQVETLPLPYYYRYPEYNKTLGGNVGAYFDVSYSYKYTTYNNKMDNVADTSILQLPTTYTQTKVAAKAVAIDTPLQVQTSTHYYKIRTPEPTIDPSGSVITLDASGYTYKINVSVDATTESGLFTTPVSMFLYHDRGAFMADISGVRNEIAYHYKAKTTARAQDITATLSFRAYANKTYYILFRTNELSFQNASFKPYTWFDTDPLLQKVYFTLSGFDPYANPLSNLTNSIYAQVNDSNFIQLPTSSNLMGLDPESSVFNANLPISEPAIGYDISGVSSDLTDYKGYLTLTDLSNVPFASYRKDPMNTFSFQKLSACDSNLQTYFPIGSSNTILSPYTNTRYLRKYNSTRQTKMVHWYDYNYIPQQTLETVPANPTDVATMTPYTSNITNLSGYTYGTSNFIQLGYGIVGFTVLPTDGVWEADSFFFKSAWNALTDCSNDAIKYLGIFKTNSITNTIQSSLHLSNAIQVLEFNKKIHYTSEQITSNNGFDNRGGTYYKFVDISGFTLANNNQSIVGFTPGSTSLLSDTSLYSVIAFNSNQNVTNMYLLSGSLVPYPEVSDASGILTYFGSSAPTNQGMVLPKYKSSYDTRFGPSNGNIYTSQYEQSMAIGTQALHYSETGSIFTDSGGFYSYSFAQTDAFQQNQSVFPLQLLAVTSSHVYTVSRAYRYDVNNHSNTSNTSNVYTIFDYQGGRNGSIKYTRIISDDSEDSNYSPSPSNDSPIFLSTYVPTSFFCTAFTSNETSFYTGLTNVTIYKDDMRDFFTTRSTYLLLDGPNHFNGVLGYTAFTYILNDPSNSSRTDSSWAVVMLPDITYHYPSGYNDLVDLNSNSNPFPVDPITIFYRAHDSLTSYQMKVKGLNGQYYTGLPTSNHYTNSNSIQDPTISLAMNSAHTNSTMFILPYDQYSYATQVKTGSTLYMVDLEKAPNPPESPVGFTQGTIVHSFTGSPNSFDKVYSYKNNTVFLTTPSKNFIYYISSSNLITSNSNYVLYNSQVSRVVQQFDLSYNSIGTMVTGPNNEVFFGPKTHIYDGDTLTPFPSYCIYSTIGIPYYYYDFTNGAWTWIISNYSIVNGWYYCYANGTLYVSPEGYNVMVAGLYGYNDPGGIPANPFTQTTTYQKTYYFEYPTNTIINNNPIDLFTNPPTTIDYNRSFIWNISPNMEWQSSIDPILPGIPVPPPPQFNIRLDTIYPPPNRNILYGNNNTINDPINTRVVQNAWQMFYPNFKLNLVKKASSTSPITNTSDLMNYPYYPHTSMFFYNSFNKMVSDISGLWAHEKKTNFIASDVSSGYMFFSYINTINLAKSSNYSSNNSSYNYLAIRGYSPTEKFKCLLRFYLPGRYDFGYMSLFNIMQEAQETVLVDLSGSALVNPTYATTLRLYNNSFKMSKIFGANSVPGFSGSNMTFTGFSNFMTQYQSIYVSGLSNANLLNSITSNVTTNVRAYIQQYLGGILPSYVLQRDIFTASLTFQIQYKSALTPAYVTLADDWGLGYNLGFEKADTPYSTVHRASSFFKILDDYIYLRLNPEFTMNRMDTTATEDLANSHESTGIVNKYAAKLLLAPFGNYATTLIQNPIQFNPTLASLDRLSFQWTDAAGTTIDNIECEWDAVVTIQERITAPKVGSTIPRPKK